jgi:hypothetical protein
MSGAMTEKRMIARRKLPGLGGGRPGKCGGGFSLSEGVM